MAWTELHDTLPDHPKLQVLVAELGSTKPHAIGLLCALWCFTLRYGKGGSLTLQYWRGFAAGMGDKDPAATLAALEIAGWVHLQDDVITCHDWDDYAGRLEDYRVANRERQRRHREKMRDVMAGHGDVTRDVTLRERESHTTQPNTTKPNQTKQTPPAAPSWALDLACELRDHVADEFGTIVSDLQVAKWAAGLDRLTRAKSLVHKPSPAEVADVVRWGMADRQTGGRWPGWGPNIRAAPDADKFAKIMAAKRRSLNEPEQYEDKIEPF